jgi:hypothetical protein
MLRVGPQASNHFHPKAIHDNEILVLVFAQTTKQQSKPQLKHWASASRILNLKA